MSRLLRCWECKSSFLILLSCYTFHRSRKICSAKQWAWKLLRAFLNNFFHVSLFSNIFFVFPRYVIMLIYHPFLCIICTDDLYYCGLRAKQTAQNFAPKEKLTRKTSRANEDQQPIYVSSNRNLSRIPRDPALKRRSISHMDRHQPKFSSLYQLNQINDPRSSLYQRLHHHSYNVPPNRIYGGHGGMWHARSYESGIGEENWNRERFIE